MLYQAVLCTDDLNIILSAGNPSEFVEKAGKTLLNIFGDKFGYKFIYFYDKIKNISSPRVND